MTPAVVVSLCSRRATADEAARRLGRHDREHCYSVVEYADLGVWVVLRTDREDAS